MLLGVLAVVLALLSRTDRALKRTIDTGPSTCSQRVPGRQHRRDVEHVPTNQGSTFPASAYSSALRQPG